MKRRAVRQGDILVMQTDRGVRGDRLAAKKGKLVIAEGELTGHHHFVKDSANVTVFDDGVDKFITVQEKRIEFLKHQTHRALALPMGESEIIQQRRIQPGSDHVVRPVFD